MHILYYFPSCSQPDHPYQALLRGGGQGLSREVHNSLEVFCQRLRSPWLSSSCAVLIPDDAGQLEELLSVADLLACLPVVVVLPDRDPRLAQKAHLLRPRFLACRDADPAHTLDVLIRISAKISTKEEDWTCNQDRLPTRGPELALPWPGRASI